MGLFDSFFGKPAASGTTAAGTPTTSTSSGQGLFLDVLQTVAEWDVLKTTGLPGELDGGIRPVSDIQNQNAERTPPAPPGGFTGFAFTPTTVAVGGAGLLALIGLILVARS